MCVTSPPYWSLRDYGVEGQIGLEPTPRAYVESLLEVFGEVKRVMRDDGTIWLNLGDSYSNSGMGGNPAESPFRKQASNAGSLINGRKAPDGLKPKDLVGIPWQVAFALRDELGFYLRMDIIWSKPNPMPECLSVDTTVFIKDDKGIHRVTLDDVHSAGEPYPLILTPTGWRPIERAWDVVKDDAIAFDAAKVQSVVCSREHLWPVSHDRRREVIHELPANSLRDHGYTDYLLHQAIAPWLNGSLSRIESHDLDYDLGWLVGLYAAEGGFGEPRGHRCKITLHANEEEIAAETSRIVAEKFHCNLSRRIVGNSMDLRFSDETWHRIAVRIAPGNVHTKSFDLDVILNSPEVFRRGVWDGYMAGDGSGRRGDGVFSVSASPDLTDSIAVLASSLGIVTSKGRRQQYDHRTGKSYVGYGIWTPYFTKRQSKKGATSKQLPIRNKRVIPGPHRMIDLQVEGGLFLIGDGLITHNSVQDRPTKAHEYLFLLSKSPTYYYDADAIREGFADERNGNPGTYRAGLASLETPGGIHGNGVTGKGWNRGAELGGRNRRSVWTVPSHPFPGSHFATFPPKLIEPCIKAGTSERGVCPACGAPWVRVTEEERIRLGSRALEAHASLANSSPQGGYRGSKRTATLGWQQGCRCRDVDPVPATVLDPFNGAGTTGVVCEALGRRYIGLDLSRPYLGMSRHRLERPHAALPGPERDEVLPLFANTEAAS